MDSAEATRAAARATAICRLARKFPNSAIGAEAAWGEAFDMGYAARDRRWADTATAKPGLDRLALGTTLARWLRNRDEAYVADARRHLRGVYPGHGAMISNGLVAMLLEEAGYVPDQVHTTHVPAGTLYRAPTGRRQA